MRSSLTDNALSFVRLFRFTPVLLIIVIITILQNSTLINSVDNLDASVVVVPLVRWGDLTEIDIALTAWTVIDGCYGTKGKTSNVPLALLLAHMYAMWTVRVPPEIDASSPTLRENARVSHSSSTLSSSSRTGLLMATLMTHKQINCIDKPITLHCPSGTNVIVQVARYVKFPSIKKSAVDICDEFGIVMEIDVDRKTESCQWYNSLEYSLLQTAVEACRSKERCQFQTSPLKFGIHPCSNDSTFVQVNYNCRPHSFNSRIGCEHEKINFECEPRTRLAIFSASYGRTQYQSVQCPQPQGVAEETCLLRYATEIVIDRCHGKKNCTLVADSKTFGKPCKEKSRVYLKVVYACVPRKVLLEKYEEEPDSTEYSFLEEVDQEDILDNPKSLAPSPNITNKKNYDNGDKSNAILLYHSPSENDYEYNYKEMKEKLYVYLIGGLSGITISIVLFIIVRLTWKRKFNDVNLRESSVENKSVEHSLKEVISEVDADVTLAVVLPPVTPMPPNHYISSPREVVRYGKENITPRSLYQDDENHFYYD